MIELTPEQEAAALAALVAKEACTKEQVIRVKPGAIDRNSAAEALHRAEPCNTYETLKQDSDTKAVISSAPSGNRLKSLCDSFKLLLLGK